MSESNPNRRETFTASDFYAMSSYLSDTVDLPYNRQIRAIVVGGAGDVVCHNIHGTSVTFAAVAGQILPIQPKRVLSTGTTATGLVGLI